jgi:GT2 family glycosyltransferase
VEFVHERFPGVDVLVNLKRAGYGENHNLNLVRARGGYFVVMNSDMIVNQDVFILLQEFLQANNDVGIVSPKILNEDGTIQGLNKRYPSLLDFLLRRFWPKPLYPLIQKRLDYYEMQDVGYDHIYDVPFLSGAFMFCRTELLKELGGFDPGYFLYFEDADLCRRVQRTHRTVYYPEVAVVHFWKRASHQNWVYAFYFIRSAFRYFNRWGYKLI